MLLSTKDAHVVEQRGLKMLLDACLHASMHASICISKVPFDVFHCCVMAKCVCKSSKHIACMHTVNTNACRQAAGMEMDASPSGPV